MLLQEGADVNQEGATAKTPLHRAILLGRPDYVGIFDSEKCIG